MVIDKKNARRILDNLDIIKALDGGRGIQNTYDGLNKWEDTEVLVIGGSFASRIKPNYPDSVFLNIYDNGAGKCHKTKEKAKEVRDEDGYIKTVEYRLVADD